MQQTVIARGPGDVRAPRARRASRGRTRLTVIETAILALAALALVAAAVGPSLARADELPGSATIKVSSNESLWTIAAGNPVDGLTTAQTVHLIKEMNGLEDSAVMDGQLLTVPSDGDTSAAMARR
ncbi:MAG: LysM peptidoglycan-binding domain-containing protein [Anaerosomatales bacterium]|nr:LysM peptidoglycan-binding domain-containing protein [Anaerosomatales bacterium]